MALSYEDITGRARELRKQIEANANVMSDEDALKFPELFPKWSEGATYSEGQRVRHNGKLVKTSKAHTSGKDKDPEKDSKRWKKVETQDTENVIEWEQVTIRNPVKKGSKVLFEGVVYESTINNNVWSPAERPDIWKTVED